MSASISRIDQVKLDQALSDIRQYISTIGDWQLALKQLSSIRDYAMGEERFCSAEAALEHCEQIKKLFPSAAPQSALDNMNAIAAEIERIRKNEIPASTLYINIVIIAAVLFAIYWFFFR